MPPLRRATGLIQVRLSTPDLPSEPLGTLSKLTAVCTFDWRRHCSGGALLAAVHAAHLAPHHARAQFAVAQVLKDCHLWQEALPRLQASLRLEPKDNQDQLARCDQTLSDRCATPEHRWPCAACQWP